MKTIYIVNDFSYRIRLDKDTDCVKYEHLCFHDLTGIEVTMPEEFYDHSPYEVISFEDFLRYLEIVS